MPEPYSAVNAEIAREVLGRALEELFANGLDTTEAAHALCREGVDLLAMTIHCPTCLEAELVAVIDACEDRFADAQDAAEPVQSKALH